MKNKKTISATIFLVLILGAISFGDYQFLKRPREDQNIIVRVHSLSPRISKKDLIKLSKAIIIGVVKDTQSKSLPGNLDDGRENIITDFRISVEKYIKNDANLNKPEIIVRMPGGKVGKTQMIVESNPSLTLGEKVIVFLAGPENDIFGFVRGIGGKYSIHSDGSIGNEQERDVLKWMFGKRDFKEADFVAEIKKIESTN